MKPSLIASPAGSLSIWDHPQDIREYVIGADVAEGKMRDITMQNKRKLYSASQDRPDYSAAVVLELETGLHVASWHGYLTPDEFALVLCGLGIYYNNACLVVEINGPGLAVITRLNETLRYENMYRSRLINAYVQVDAAMQPIGWQTNKHNRHVLIDHIHDAVNNANLFTRDRKLISELRTMEVDPATGSPRARGKNKDDRVFALGLALEGRYTLMGHGYSSMRPAGRAISSYDQKVWERVRQQQEASGGRRLSGGGLGSLPVLSRPPRPLG